MQVEFAAQYGKCYLLLDGTENPDEVMNAAREVEALHYDGEDLCLVLQFPNRPKELYTEEAMRRSLVIHKRVISRL